MLDNNAYIFSLRSFAAFVAQRQLELKYALAYQIMNFIIIPHDVVELNTLSLADHLLLTGFDSLRLPSRLGLTLEAGRRFPFGFLSNAWCFRRYQSVPQPETKSNQGSRGSKVLAQF
jgi:hypothetical protein